MNFIFKIGFVKWLLILSAFFTLLEATVNTFPEDLFKYTHCKINNAYYIVPLSRYDITKNKNNRCEGYYHTISDAVDPICLEAVTWVLKNNMREKGIAGYLHKKWSQSYRADPKFGIRIECKENR